MASTQAQETIIPIFNFEGGEMPDQGETVSMPGWLKLSNFYYNGKDELRGRPHKLNQYSNSILKGLARSPKNALIRLADGNLYVGSSLVNAMNGSGDLVFAHLRDRTLLAAGGNAYQLNSAGTVLETLSLANIYAIESGFGGNYDRAFYVSSNDKRQVKYSDWGNAGDVGTLITDPDSINDEYTEGGDLNPVDYDIIDIHLFAGELVVFTLQAIYRFSLGVDEFGFDGSVVGRFDLNILNIRPVRFSSGILFFCERGLMYYSIGQNGPTVDSINMTGIFRTIMKSLVISEARLCADDVRGLLFLKPNNSSGITHVYNQASRVWTRWDFGVEHAVTINGNTFIGKYGDGDTYLLDDVDASTEEPYTFIIQGGLDGHGDPTIRKRWKTVGMNFVHDDILDLSMEVVPENIVPSYTPVLQQYQPEISRVEQYCGLPGRRGSILIQGTNRGEFVLPINDQQNPPIYIKTLLKKPKIPSDGQHAAD